MMRLAVAAVVLAVAAAAVAQNAPVPEQCIAKSSSAVSVTHGGKSYRLANEACREQFLSDPERYAQLYDALLELEAEGTPLAAPTASLVPS
jgi:YHS domain-containing protein